MYDHYLKPALRKVVNAKLYSLISILSLAIGMTVTILIFSFIRYETSFDSMHADSGRIYRLNWTIPEAGSHFATFFNPVTPLLAEALPEIESFSRLAIRKHLFTVGDVDQYATLSLVDDDFFGLFHYPALAGDPNAAIRERSSAVLTEAAALKLFGTRDAIGETFTVDGAHDFRVAAVVERNPPNSHLGSNIFVHIDNLTSVWGFPPEFWSAFNSDLMYHYVELAPGANAETVTAAAQDLIARAVPGVRWQVDMQPLREIHFTTDLQNEMSTIDDVSGVQKPLRQRSDVLIFAGVGVLTLLLASFNFMNMQLVQFTKHTREIGIRRVVGSSHLALIAQLLSETALIATAALLVALALCELLAPYFSAMLAMPIEAGSLSTLSGISVLATLLVLVGVLAGLYPALTVTSSPTASMLRGEMSRGVSSTKFRSALITLQFAISIGLIVGSFVVKNQLDYALSKPLGFDPVDVVTIELPNDAARGAYETMRDELLGFSGIISVSAGSTIPTRDLSDGFGATPVGGDPDNPLLTRGVIVGESYFETLGMDIVAGRALSERFATDALPAFSPERTSFRGGLILNETAARLAGWTNLADAIGAELYSSFVVSDIERRTDYTLVGVVADAHYGSIRREIEPVTYRLTEVFDPRIMVVKAAAGDVQRAIGEIDRVWQRNVPDFPIQRALLSDTYSAFYSGEERTFILFIALSAMAILVACMGLYALTTFVAEQRSKEISIRKVLGATVARVSGLLAWDFCRFVIVANIIAWPLAWWLMRAWLENFAYRVDFGIEAFVLAGLAAFGVALVTTLQSAYSVATISPVRVLRKE